MPGRVIEHLRRKTFQAIVSEETLAELLSSGSRERLYKFGLSRTSTGAFIALLRLHAQAHRGGA